MMLDTTSILQSLKRYQKEEFPSEFLQQTIQYFEGPQDYITMIPENKYALAGIHLHLLYHPMTLYLSKKKWNINATYRKLKLSKIQTDNLFNQIDGLQRNDFLICRKKKATSGVYYLYLSSEELKGKDDSKIPIDLQGCLLGIASLEFLQHQNLDSYCSDVIINHSESLYKELRLLRHKLSKLPPLVRERMMVFSGLIYHFLGTVYTRDIDLLFIAKGVQEKPIQTYLDYKDFILIYPPGKEDPKDPWPYKQNWFRTKLPQLGDIPDIYTMLIDPEHHFYFMGLKCMDLFTTFKRSASRSAPPSMVDALLLKKINNLDYIKDYCIKNITVRQGKAFVMTDQMIAKNFETVKKSLKEWYNIDVSIAYLEQHFKKCEEVYKTIYYNRTSINDPLMSQIASFNRSVSQKYILYYGRNKESLFDIGSGKLTGASIYKKANLKYVYGIEPSIYSIELAKDTIAKYPEIYFDIRQGYGDRPFFADRTFDVITLIFTIHYMVNGFDVLMENILRLCKKGTIVIITYVNGTKLLPMLREKGKYEVRYQNDIYWGVYKYNDPLQSRFPKVLFYMKDVYGVENGSEEYILEPEFLEQTFQSNGFKRILRKTFLQEYNPLLKFKEFQKQILEYHEIMVFVKL